MSKKILAYGEILWDILPDKTILGGAPFNFAYRIHSLGDEGLFASSVGADELGARAQAHASALGIDVSLLQVNRDYPTGTVKVSFDEKLMPDFDILPDVAFDNIQLTDDLFYAAAAAECLCFGTLIQRSNTSRQTLYELINAASDAVKFLDINLRKKCYSRETILYSLEKANILKLNEDEVFQLEKILGLSFESFPGFCDFVLNEWNLDYILITFGELGAFAQSSLGQQVYVPGYKIQLADSVGAGDAFAAAFVHGLLGGHSLQIACENGNALGALVAMTIGATAQVPQGDVVALLRSKTDRLYHPEFM